MALELENSAVSLDGFVECYIKMGSYRSPLPFRYSKLFSVYSVYSVVKSRSFHSPLYSVYSVVKAVRAVRPWSFTL